MLSLATYAQEFDVNMQLRPRFEYRNGYKEPIPYGVNPGEFISNRTRLNFNFKQDKFVTKLTLQNIRVWGDVQTTSKSDVNGIELFEAWGQYNFSEKWSARIGRQVISYDNQRIFGEIDWLQQGQSHDAALVTFKDKKNQLDLGIAINAGAEVNTETPYVVANYKNMQYAWFHTQFSKLNASLLFLNTGYENQIPLPLPTPLPELTVDYMQTFGTYLNSKGKKWDANLWFYGQTGKSNGNSVSAYDAALNFNYALTEKFKAGIGYEFLSGKSQTDTGTTIKSFYPLFGTNHAFNGLMDYFYVGNYKNSVGLQDVFLKFSYAVEKWQFNLSPHLFYAGNTVLDANKVEMNNYYGTEIDYTMSYSVNKYISASGGYSQMFGTETLQRVKGGDTSHTNNWAWLMININPQLFLSKK
jgi:hypothetical protein